MIPMVRPHSAHSRQRRRVSEMVSAEMISRMFVVGNCTGKGGTCCRLWQHLLTQDAACLVRRVYEAPPVASTIPTEERVSLPSSTSQQLAGRCLLLQMPNLFRKVHEHSHGLLASDGQGQVCLLTPEVRILRGLPIPEQDSYSYWLRAHHAYSLQLEGSLAVDSVPCKLPHMTTTVCWRSACCNAIIQVQGGLYFGILLAAFGCLHSDHVLATRVPMRRYETESCHARYFLRSTGAPREGCPAPWSGSFALARCYVTRESR